MTRRILLFALLATALGGCSRGPSPGTAADLVIRQARVYTVDAQNPWAEAVAIRGDKILWVGADREAGRFIASSTRVVNAEGRLLLPGFIDSHFHVGLGSDPDVLRISNENSLKEIQAQVREFARRRPELQWIEAEGWNYSAFPGGRLPTARDLAGLTGGRPAFLVSYDYHTVWLNREALRALGVTPQTRQVAFAEQIQRDPGSGEPTGILMGFGSAGLSAQAEVELRRTLPSHSRERLGRRVRANLAAAVRAGITTVVDPQSSLDDVETYSRLREREEFPARLQVALFFRRGSSAAELQRFDLARTRFNNDRFRVAAIKLYIDDVIEPHTAALLQPYADRPDTRGETLYRPGEFNDVVARVDRRHFQIFIHATGDRGIRTALDALEFARKLNGPRDSRHELVHIECLSPQDLPRFHELGVIACMQPRHCAPDITGQWARAIGPERSHYAWAFRSLHDAGATLAFASDWNVAEMEPLIGIYTALTRKGLGGNPGNGWIPEQTIDLETAIRAYTLNGAYANFADENRGSITPGKYADLALLSDDLFQIPPERIKDARVVLTLVGGKEVYRAF